MMPPFVTKLTTQMLGRSLTPDYSDTDLRFVVPELERAEALAEQGGHGSLAVTEPTEASVFAWFAAIRILLALPAAGERAASGALVDAWHASPASARLHPLQRHIVDAVLRDDDVAFAVRSPEARSELVRALQSAYRELHRTLDVRSGARLRGEAYGRMFALALAVVLVVVRFGAALFPAHNLARGKPVTASTSMMSPSGMVDGKLEGIVGVHTQVGAQNAFVQIDLTASKRVRTIVIYNRGDRNLDDGLPLWLEASEDGTTFREIGRRDKRFGDGSFAAPPWTQKVDETCRYIRIRSSAYIALSEVEVF
jgi:hypothetical protein